MLFDIYIMSAIMEEVVACNNSDLNKCAKTRVLTMAMTMSSIQAGCASILGGNNLLKFSKVSSSDISSITLPSILR